MTKTTNELLKVGDRVLIKCRRLKKDMVFEIKTITLIEDPLYVRIIAHPCFDHEPKTAREQRGE